MILEGKRLLITGVVDTESIAFATAARAQELGAEVILSGLPRNIEQTQESAQALPTPADVVAADLTSPDDIESLGRIIGDRMGGLDGALHAIAFAPRSALAGDFLDPQADDLNIAFQTSAVSYASLASILRDLAPSGGGSLVGLDFDAAGAWPVYNWMGVCKAALEAASRYLARDLGKASIRSNLIAAGPIHTRAAGGIPDFQLLLDAWQERAPLNWDPTDSKPVADTACFLLSDLSRAITGEILHVDGGYHAMAGPLRRSESSPAGSELQSQSSERQEHGVH